MLSFASPFQVQATLPEKNIVFWGLGQSNEQKDNDLIKAYNLAKKSNYEQALKIINQKIQISPKSTTLHVIKGLILNEMRMFLPAIRELNNAQLIESRHPGIHFGFCKVYRNLGMSELSLQACRVTVEIHRLSPEAHYEYAQTLIANGNMELANRSLSTAAELDTNQSKSGAR